MAVQIESLVPGDEARLRAIRLRSLIDSPNAFAATYAEVSSFSLEVWRDQLNRMATFIATAGQGDVGIVRGARHDDIDDTAYLLSMWVAPEMRRQGIAGALIDALIEWARQKKFRRMVLDVAETNLGARTLYERKGFVANGHHDSPPPPHEHIREFQLELLL